MIFGGDFQQILPIVTNGSCADIVNACLKKSYIWNDIHILKLQLNMRLQHPQENISSTNWLLNVGHGRNINNNNNIDIPLSMSTTSKYELINKIYGDINKFPLTPLPVNSFLEHAILTPRNVDVQDANKKILKKMQGDNIIYHGADTLEDEGEGTPTDIPHDFLHTIESPSLPLSDLQMKIGCPLMILHN